MLNLGVLAMPIAFTFMVLSSYISPKQDHVKLLKLEPNDIPLQIEYSSGSYSCVNTLCDYSQYNNEYTYLVVPRSFVTDTFYVVSKSYSGDLKVTAYEQHESIWLLSILFIFAMLLMLAYGSFMAWYYIKHITRRLSKSATNGAA